MGILVSCCSDDGDNGGIFRLVKNNQNWEIEKIFGIEVRGLCKFSNNYVAISEHARELMILDKNFQLMKSKQIELGAHGITYAAGLIYQVDTMNDCIRVFTVDLEEVKIISIRNNPEESPDDYDLRHINDIQLFIYHNTTYLIYTCFRYDLLLFQANQATSENKRDPRHCYGLGALVIRDISNSHHLGSMELSGLWQPHSPYYDSKENKLYVLSSRDSRLIIMENYQPFCVDKNIQEIIILGFLRGLLVGLNNLYVGKSSLRGEPETTCGVYVMNKKELNQTTFIPLPANEVYSIISEESLCE